jgi:hypothetical protein
MQRKGAEEARNLLPELLEETEKGRSSIVARQQSATPLRGSGRELWGKNSARTLDKLRKEWNRSQSPRCRRP